MADLQVNVHHIARVEGHGNIVINVADGKMEECRLEICESPRFFEAFVRGRKYDEIPAITSRICGICNISHSLAAIQAIEHAMGITPSELTVKLRKLILYAEFIQSHILHVYFLVAPDVFGAPSVIPLASSKPDIIKRALRMKKIANELCAVLGGRHIHAIPMCVGGTTHYPSMAELEGIKKKMGDAWSDVEATIALFASIALPDFDRETEYVSLRYPDEYALYEGDIFSSVLGETPCADYKKRQVNEYVVPYSAAKQVFGGEGPYMVGALARFNNNFKQLDTDAKEAASTLKLPHPCFNPYKINLAQVVETVHCWNKAMEMIDEFMEWCIEPEELRVEIKPGRGVGAVEAPRGILFHEYEVDEKGTVVWANNVIPTGQNLANIELDMRSYIPKVLDKPKEQIQLLSEMLVRAYDPCISCATHFLDIEYK